MGEDPGGENWALVVLKMARMVKMLRSCILVVFLSRGDGDGAEQAKMRVKRVGGEVHRAEGCDGQHRLSMLRVALMSEAHRSGSLRRTPIWRRLCALSQAVVVTAIRADYGDVQDIQQDCNGGGWWVHLVGPWRLGGILWSLS